MWPLGGGTDLCSHLGADFAAKDCVGPAATSGLGFYFFRSSALFLPGIGGVTGMQGEVFDGIPQRNLPQAPRLARLLCALAGKELTALPEATIWLQRDAHSCGAFALAHATHRLTGSSCPSLLVEASNFLANFPPVPATLFGQGGLTSDQEQALLKLLVSKGVPQAASSQRRPIG